jgi:hypothetical protein
MRQASDEVLPGGLTKVGRGGHVLPRFLVGFVLFVLLAGIWACLWVPLS